MALHEYFRDSTNRAVFEDTFRDWVGRLEEMLEEVGEDGQHDRHEYISALHKELENNREEIAALPADKVKAQISAMREKVSNKVRKIMRDVETYHQSGPTHAGYLRMNASMHFNDLSPKEMATVLVHQDLVAEVVKRDATVTTLRTVRGAGPRQVAG